MTPTDFQAVALAWVAAVTTVVIAVLLAYAKIMPIIADLKKDHALNAQQIEQNTARLDRQGQAQTALLLASPAPGTNAAPTTVNAPAAETVNVNTGDTPSAEVPVGDVSAPIAPTPEPAPENKSVVVDRDFLATTHAAIGAALSAGQSAGVPSDDGPAVSAPGQPDLTPRPAPDAPVEAPAPLLAPPTA